MHAQGRLRLPAAKAEASAQFGQAYGLPECQRRVQLRVVERKRAGFGALGLASDHRRQPLETLQDGPELRQATGHGRRLDLNSGASDQPVRRLSAHRPFDRRSLAVVVTVVHGQLLHAMVAAVADVGPGQLRTTHDHLPRFRFCTVINPDYFS